MTWNWQLDNWPNFRYKKEELVHFEQKFQLLIGKLDGSFIHLDHETQRWLSIQLISESALKTSEIEGEVLNRDSIQSSIAKHFGLKLDNRKVPPAERGISEMFMNMHSTFNEPLTHEMLHNWHKILMNSRINIETGKYRSQNDPMQIVSGRYDEPTIHYEAIPSKRVTVEMNKFITWFNNSLENIPALTRAGIAHWHHICIHPFEDGNGRISRLISEKAISQSIGKPTIIAISQTINDERNKYYEILKEHNHTNEITDWLTYFCQTTLDAVDYAQKQVEFIINTTKFMRKYKNLMNQRQEKVITKTFTKGINGFEGGLSAEKYIKITKTSRATATRDLTDLVNKEILRKEGQGKGTRYYPLINS